MGEILAVELVQQGGEIGAWGQEAEPLESSLLVGDPGRVVDVGGPGGKGPLLISAAGRVVWRRAERELPRRRDACRDRVELAMTVGLASVPPWPSGEATGPSETT